MVENGRVRSHAGDAPLRFPGEPRLRYVEERAAVRLGRATQVSRWPRATSWPSSTMTWWWTQPGSTTASRPSRLADDIACVTGLILPLTLESQSQLLLEQFATFGKGFRRKVYRLPDGASQDPLFP